MSLQYTSETVSTKRRITQIVTQFQAAVPATANAQRRPYVQRSVSRHNQVMTGGTKMSTGHIRDRDAAVREGLSVIIIQ